jgi:hydroxymethylglutaryl-CoA reductase
VDDELAVAGECQDDHFEELAIAARTNHRHLRRISIRVHVHDNRRMLDCVEHGLTGDAMSTRRPMSPTEYS